MKQLLRKIFFPPCRVIIIVDMIAFPLVIFVLKELDSMHPLSFLGYFLSSYALAVTLMNLRRMVLRAKELLGSDEVRSTAWFRRQMHKNKYTARYLEDREFRAETALYTGLAVNLLYAVFRIAEGYINSSVWYYSLGAYYIVFGAIRYMLMRSVLKNRGENNINSSKLREWRAYRSCGLLMLVMNAVMSVIAAQMVIENKGNVFSRTAVIISAAFTFYCFILAIYNMFSFGKAGNAILSAAKNLTFAGAAMSLYSLQTSMLIAFDEDTRSGFRRFMNAATGAAVTIIVLAISVFMIIRGNLRIKRFSAVHREDDGHGDA